MILLKIPNILKIDNHKLAPTLSKKLKVPFIHCPKSTYMVKKHMHSPKSTYIVKNFFRFNFLNNFNQRIFKRQSQEKKKIY
jgi:hypothetical protein